MSHGKIIAEMSVNIYGINSAVQKNNIQTSRKISTHGLSDRQR
jgi:hypothetical protein